MQKDNYELSVFINCPFDSDYEEMFNALIYVIKRCNFIPRCAKESDDTNDIRITKIISLIKDCKYSIHDISRTNLDKHNNLPRFNMPLELGVVIGSINFGTRRDKLKKYLLLDSDQYRFKQYISDLSGQDIKSHNNEPKKIIESIRNWLTQINSDLTIPSSTNLYTEYLEFQKALPDLCNESKWLVSELTYNEYVSLIDAWKVLIAKK